MLRRILLALALLATGEAAKAKADPKECEVCIANLEAIDKLIDKDEKTSKQSIMEAITKHCGDLQNEQPNPALNARDPALDRPTLPLPYCGWYESRNLSSSAGFMALVLPMAAVGMGILPCMAVVAAGGGGRTAGRLRCRWRGLSGSDK